MKKLILLPAIILAALACHAQDKVETHMLTYDPDNFKIIPDKFFEMGIPLLALLVILNTIVLLIKNRAEQRLKLKMLEKDISEDTLIVIFKESNTVARLQPLKWFLFTFASALFFLTIHVCRNYLINQSGWLAVSIFLLYISAAFFIYYQILSRKQ